MAGACAAGAALIQALIGRRAACLARTAEAEVNGGPEAAATLSFVRVIGALDRLDISSARELCAARTIGTTVLDDTIRRSAVACMDRTQDPGATLLTLDAAWGTAAPAVRQTPLRACVYVYLRARLLLLNGRVRAARDLLASAPAYASSEASAEMASMRALAELACGEHDAALRHAYLASQQPAKPRSSTLGQAVIAAVLAARGDPAASAACDRALRLADEHDLGSQIALLPEDHLLAVLAASSGSATADAIRELLASGELRVPRAIGRLVDPLSEREQEMLRRLAAGASIAAAAKRMFISPNTAHTHVRSLYRKLGASSRSEMAAHAIEYGLL